MIVRKATGPVHFLLPGFAAAADLLNSAPVLGGERKAVRAVRSARNPSGGGV